MKDKKRCDWPGDDPLMIKYHDQEWGVPVYDDKKIFEFLVLESAQAGLSWRTILHKREGYKKLFANFDYKKIAKFTTKDVARLIKDPAIIRNRLKILATINNAQRFLEVQKEFGSFSKYMWQFVGGKVIHGKWKLEKDTRAPSKEGARPSTSTGALVPTITKEAEIFSKDLKKRGFKFLGPTVVYAHMQAVGMVNDHVVSCFRYGKVKK